MTAVEPKVAPTGQYSAPQACRLLGIHRNSLLKYTKESKIKCGFRRDTKRRFYTGSELLRFWRVGM